MIMGKDSEPNWPWGPSTLLSPDGAPTWRGVGVSLGIGATFVATLFGINAVAGHEIQSVAEYLRLKELVELWPVGAFLVILLGVCLSTRTTTASRFRLGHAP